MSETAVLPRSANIVETDLSVLVAGVGLTSFASLLFELALTRLFSVVFFYHFAFLAISIALLGLGAGGVFAHRHRCWLARWTVRRLGAALCGINAGVIPLAVEVLHTPLKLDVSWANCGRLSLMYAAVAIPFFLTGVLFSSVFARESRIVHKLYSADLAGGAVSCLAVVPLLNWLGGPNAMLFAALVMAGAAIIWADARRLRQAAALMAVEASASITIFLPAPTWSTSTRESAFHRAKSIQGWSRRSPLAYTMSMSRPA